MIWGRKSGFTIIETLIVVGISGLLVAVAIFGVATRQQSVQFTDAMRSFQSFLETQYSAAQSGVNDIQSGDGTGCSTTGGNSGGCLMLGRVMTFEVGSSEVRYFSLLSDVLTADDVVDGFGDIEYSNPRLENTARDYSIPWGAEFLGGSAYNLSTNTRVPSYAFGYIRAPRSSSVTGVTYKATAGDNFTATRNIVDAPVTYGDTSIFDIGPTVDAYYCFENYEDGDLDAVIILSGAQVDLEFYPTATDYPGCGL